MKIIRVTSEDENGIFTFNDKIAVMTDEDFIYLQETLKSDVEVHVAVGLRFEAMEKLISILSSKIDILEKILLRGR